MRRRSRTLARAAIAVVALGIAVLVAQQGLGRWLEDRSPVLASRIAPNDARVAVAAARAAAGGSPNFNAPGVSRLVDRALKREVALPSAIELRALQFAAAGDARRSERLFHLSDAISRRSLPTRLWLIQRSVDRGDVAGALGNFDIALRTSISAPTILFPVLAGATTDPALVGPIARMLDRPSHWRIPFLFHAVQEEDVATGVSDVVLRMREHRTITQSKLDQALIAELVSNYQFRRARQIHNAFHPGAPTSPVNDKDFSRQELGFPFGWGLRQDANAWASREFVNDRPALEYQSVAAGEGQVASQLLMLVPGHYRLSVRSASAASDPAAPAYWTLTCGGAKGVQIGLLDQPVVAGAVGTLEFRIPASCDAQWLALNLRPSESSGGQSGAVASVNIRRQGA